MPNNRPVAIYQALAAQCQQATGITSIYPLPSRVPTKLTLIILGSTLRISRTGNQQLWLIRARGLLSIPMTGEIEKETIRADEALPEIADAFDGRDDVNASRLGGIVDRCAFEEANLMQKIEIGGLEYIGHELFWDIKAHRFKGDA